MHRTTSYLYSNHFQLSEISCIICWNFFLRSLIYEVIQIEVAKVVETQGSLERQLELIETHQQEVNICLSQGCYFFWELSIGPNLKQVWRKYVDFTCPWLQRCGCWWDKWDFLHVVMKGPLWFGFVWWKFFLENFLYR